ncbi:uncharacterized protein BDR25DRAFT_385740 [Lindgomyces ingoldianus]|uniref:Uncharacterized protein n=1 Tax=Lindgomyces ingoldianus TaxID=673940 RepID=A0ACB6R4V5_9PLEO|nr:uncharacterized protein BDR25DRAFT_385740 [Lindgomyces ingoldianus]KAF2474279.1 hypothetical protein BDR25DRAFT_385740 [Lindgomyces ingoldianus]
MPEEPKWSASLSAPQSSTSYRDPFFAPPLKEKHPAASTELFSWTGVLPTPPSINRDPHPMYPWGQQNYYGLQSQSGYGSNATPEFVQHPTVGATTSFTPYDTYETPPSYAEAISPRSQGERPASGMRQDQELSIPNALPIGTNSEEETQAAGQSRSGPASATPLEELTLTCKFCGVGFKEMYRNGNQKRHIRQLHAECEQAFKLADARRRHRLRQHRVSTPTKKKRNVKGRARFSTLDEPKPYIPTPLFEAKEQNKLS